MTELETVTRLRTPFDADCWRCAGEVSKRLKAAGERALSLSYRMYLCPECGNKRCPKATWHELDCTGNNKLGQAGSIDA